MEIVDTETLAEKEWSGLVLPAPYSDVLGEPSPHMTVLVWGPKGSGKSTFAMGLASALLPYAKAQEGTVLYVSAEEGAGRTTAERAQRLGASDEALLVSDFRSYGALFDAIEGHNARAVVLDSATVISSAQSKDAAHLMETLRKVGVAGIIVSHALKGGDGYKGNSAIGHACYAEVKCYPDELEDEAGVRHVATAVKNRYGPTVGNVVQIPMEEDQILPLTDEAIEHSIRENFGDAPRDVPTSNECRAIFAELSEEGQDIRTRSEDNEDESTPSTPQNPKGEGKQEGREGEGGSRSSAQTEGSGSTGSSSLDHLESTLHEAIT